MTTALFILADTTLPKRIIKSIIFLLYFTPVAIAYLKIVLASSNSRDKATKSITVL